MNVFKFKKGQSNIIGWVLLIGFAVSLAVFIGRWSLQHAEESSETVVKGAEVDLRCANVAISANCENSVLVVRNKGTVRVHGLTIAGSLGNTCPFESVINLNDQIPLSSCIDRLQEKLTIIPKVEIDGEKFACSTKKLVEVNKC